VHSASREKKRKKFNMKRMNRDDKCQKKLSRRKRGLQERAASFKKDLSHGGRKSQLAGTQAWVTGKGARRCSRGGDREKENESGTVLRDNWESTTKYAIEP